MKQKLLSMLLAAVLGVSAAACADVEPDVERDDPVGTTLPEEMTPATPGLTTP